MIAVDAAAAAAADFVANVVVVEAVEAASGKIAVVLFHHVADAYITASAPGA